MDINMPKLDGIGATRRIKAHDKGVKVIGLSVHSDQYHEEAMIDAGAAELLAKENASHDSYGAIQRAVARKDLPPPKVNSVRQGGWIGVTDNQSMLYHTKVWLKRTLTSTSASSSWNGKATTLPTMCFAESAVSICPLSARDRLRTKP